MRPTPIVYCFIAVFSLLLSGCATTGQNSAEQTATPSITTASALYTAGKAAMNSGDTQSAISAFNKLISQYPDDKFALQGRLELAYAYHKTGQTSATIATTESFIKDFPQHKNSDYAYYLRGLSAYDAAIHQLNQESAAVPYEAKMALKFLTEFNQRFPEGKYSADTDQRIDTLNERIAQRLIASAKQALDENNPAQAALLAKSVVEEHPNTSVIQEAAIVTNQAYRLLGLSSDGTAIASTAAAITPVAAAAITPTIELPARATADTVSNTAPASTSASASQVNDSQISTNEMAASNTIRDTTWVRSQAADHYTIQVLGTESEAQLRQQIERNKLQNDVAYYKRSRDGNTWYSLIYGSYASRAAAESAAKTLPPVLRNNQPWIRKIGDIQASLSE